MFIKLSTDAEKKQGFVINGSCIVSVAPYEFTDGRVGSSLTYVQGQCFTFAYVAETVDEIFEKLKELK